jgi:hypothetical protein
MDELWHLVNNQLNGPLGLGAFTVLFGVMFVPIFFLIKMLAARSRDSRQLSIGAGEADAFIRSSTDARPATGVPVTTQSSEGITWSSASTFTPVQGREGVQTTPAQIAEVMQKLGGTGPARPTIYKNASFALIVLMVGLVVFGRMQALPAGLIVITLVSFAGVATFVSQMHRFGRMMSAGGFNRNVTFTINHQSVGGDPTVIKMDADALQRARGLISAGMNIDAVCREINPTYASWGMIEQGLFRKVIEAVLKQEGAGGVATPDI